MKSILGPWSLAILLAPAAAKASEPSSIYTAPAEVEILPDDATGTRVVIGGSFFFLSTPADSTYGEPRCGYMSFQCPAGLEVMCRMQWLDIRRAIGGAYCAGFGTLHVVSSATLHPDRGTLVKPDLWDLGMGIAQGAYVDGKCGPARMLSCAAPPPDGGPADVAETPDVPAPAPPVDAAVVAPDAEVAKADALAPAPAKPSGCAAGGTGGLFPLLVAFLALLRRARR
jgi:uncharacterized protein (TIGR03382 family)